MPDPQPLPAPPTRQELLRATLAALGMAAVVLVAAVLPAEYGIDPTGIGTVAGFTKLSDARGGEPEVVTAPGGPKVLLAHEAAFTLAETTLGSWEGYAEALTTQRIRVEVNVTNLTSLKATLRWDDANATGGQRSAPDELEVSVEAPDGRRSLLVAAHNGADGLGEAEATLAWKPVPFPREEDGAVVFPALAPDTSGHGAWTVVVRMYGAGGFPPGVEGEDRGNAWNLTVRAEHYALALDRAEGGRAAWDEATIVLRPGDDVEYKFQMAEGARLRYAWRSTGPVYSDFHGDHGESHDDFTRYREATATADEGTLTAAFEGRHGWYFHNRGQAEVTVTLQTRGDYEILGSV